MIISRPVHQLFLRPADRVIVPKSLADIVQHHGVYWGQDVTGQHWFIHNHVGSGVQFISAENFLQGIPAYRIRVQRFAGNDSQRRTAIYRAVSMLKRPYDLLTYNCEHYSNEVQYGKPESKQVGKGLIIAASFLCCLLGGASTLK